MPQCLPLIPPEKHFQSHFQSANLQLLSQIGRILACLDGTNSDIAFFGNFPKSRRDELSSGSYHTPSFSYVFKAPASTLAGYDFQVTLCISCSFSLLVESTLELTCDSDVARLSNVPCGKHQTYE